MTLRLSAFIALILIMPYRVKAQATPSFGLTGGLSQSYILSSAKNVIIHQPGFQVGASWHLPLTESFRVQPELVFAQQALVYEYAFNGFGYSTTGNTRSTIRLIQLPIWVQFGRKTYFGIGMSWGFPVYTKATTTSITTARSGPTTIETSTDVADFNETFRYKQWSLGISVGHRSQHFAWEIRPSLTIAGLDGHFWRGFDDTGYGIFQVTGVLTWLNKAQ